MRNRTNENLIEADNNTDSFIADKKRYLQQKKQRHCDMLFRYFVCMFFLFFAVTESIVNNINADNGLSMLLLHFFRWIFSHSLER